MIKKIEYEDKISIQNDESVAEINKVTDTDMNEIKQVVNNNADELEQAQEDIQNNTESIKQIKEKDLDQDKLIKQLQVEKEELQLECKRLREDNASNKTKMSDLETKNTEQDTNIQKNTDDIKTINEKNKSQDTEITNIKSEQATQNTNIANLQTDNTTNKSNITKNSSDITTLKSNVTDINAKIDNIQSLRGHIYGVRRKITNNTNTAWERIKDSIGLVANATKNGGSVTNNFDTLAPWSEIKTCNYDIETGKVKAWFGDATFNFDGTNGDVFTYIPDVYLKIYQENDYDYILISDIPRSGFVKYDSFFIARYAGSVVNDKLHSYTGLAPTVSKTIGQFRTLVKALGDKFSLLDYRYFIIQMLYLVEYADYNSQAKLGQGVCSITWNNKWDGLSAGGCDSLGMKSGCLVDDGKHSVIYRGMENIYSNMWQFVDGITVQDRVAYICKDHSQYADSKITAPYKKVGYTNGNTNGYTKNLGFDPDEPLFRFPVEVGGGSSSGTGDYYYQDAGTRLALVGGFFGNGANCGFWCWHLNLAFSFSSVSIGCRVLIDNQ